MYCTVLLSRVALCSTKYDNVCLFFFRWYFGLTNACITFIFINILFLLFFLRSFFFDDLISKYVSPRDMEIMFGNVIKRTRSEKAPRLSPCLQHVSNKAIHACRMQKHGQSTSSSVRHRWSETIVLAGRRL